MSKICTLTWQVFIGKSGDCPKGRLVQYFRWPVCLFACVSRSNSFPQHLSNFYFFFFFSQDTIAIKKHSSRTRRIRPVSTRLSEYCCIAYYPLSSVSSDPFLVSPEAPLAFSVVGFPLFSISSSQKSVNGCYNLAWAKSESLYVRAVTDCFEFDDFEAEMMTPCNLPTLWQFLLSFLSSHPLYPFVAPRCHQACVMTPAPLHPLPCHHTRHRYPVRHPGRVCQSCLRRVCPFIT